MGLVYNVFVFVERHVIYLNDIEVKNLKKRFGDFDVIKDISIEIKSGEFLAILGPNGAGKSTLLKIMTTLLKHYDGKIEICGYDIEKYPKKVREQIGVVPENFILYDRLTDKTIVFTTHILSEVEELATKIAVLNFGKLVAFGAPDELSIMAEDKDQKDLIVEVDKKDSKNYKAFFDKNGIRLEMIGNTMKFLYSDGNELEKIIKLISEFEIPVKSINSSNRNFDRIFLKLIDKGRDKN